MTILSAFPVIADIVPPPPPHSLPTAQAPLDIVPYFVLAGVAFAALVYLWRRRAAMPAKVELPGKG